MKKVLILSSLILSMLTGSSQAAETNCNDNVKRDHPVNYRECADTKMFAKERGQVDLSSFAITSDMPSMTASQNVLCSQCHQSWTQMDQMSGNGSKRGKSIREASR